MYNIINYTVIRRTDSLIINSINILSTFLANNTIATLRRRSRRPHKQPYIKHGQVNKQQQ